jgi:hypothetical protein
MSDSRRRMKWFDVSLYSVWWQAPTTGQIADCTASVQAPGPFSAIEGLMRHHGLSYAAYAVAYAEDHSIIYRGYKIRVQLHEASKIGEIAGYDVFKPVRPPVRLSARKRKGETENDEYVVYPFA